MCIKLEIEDKVRMAQHVDEELRRIVTIMLKPSKIRTKPEQAIAREYTLKGKLLYRLYQGKQLFVMPRSMRKSIVVAAHDLGGHLSVDKTVCKITQDFWFVGLRRYVRLHVRMCFGVSDDQKAKGQTARSFTPYSTGKEAIRGSTWGSHRIICD